MHEAHVTKIGFLEDKAGEWRNTCGQWKGEKNG